MQLSRGNLCGCDLSCVRSSDDTGTLCPRKICKIRVYNLQEMTVSFSTLRTYIQSLNFEFICHCTRGSPTFAGVTHIQLKIPVTRLSRKTPISISKPGKVTGSTFRTAERAASRAAAWFCTLEWVSMHFRGLTCFCLCHRGLSQKKREKERKRPGGDPDEKLGRPEIVIVMSENERFHKVIPGSEILSASLRGNTIASETQV